MKREEISELMKAKDDEIQADIDFNKHVFETIKQSVMDEIITYCINTSSTSKEYTIYYDTVKNIVIRQIFEMEELPVNADDKVLFNNIDLRNYMGRLELFSVCSSVSKMLEDHGFKYRGDYHSVLSSFSITKENLLRYPEIIYNGIGDVESVPDQQNQQGEKVVLGALNFLAISLAFIVLWVFIYLAF